MASDPFLVLSDLAVDYGGGEVVRGVDVTVAPGEIVTLLGPNGAGKSSTLLATIGLVPRSRGTVSIGGTSLKALSPELAAGRGLMLVPDDRGLFPKMSVADHLWLGAHGRLKPAQSKMVYDVFPILEERRKQSAGSLSGGEAQMLSIAVALLAEPKVLLIDELSFGLAPIIVGQLLTLCRELADERGIGILLVEQFVDLALRTSDRMIVMTGGRFVLEGRAAEFLDRREEIHEAYLGAASHATAP